MSSSSDSPVVPFLDTDPHSHRRYRRVTASARPVSVAADPELRIPSRRRGRLGGTLPPRASARRSTQASRRARATPARQRAGLGQPRRRLLQASRTGRRSDGAQPKRAVTHDVADNPSKATSPPTRSGAPPCTIPDADARRRSQSGPRRPPTPARQPQRPPARGGHRLRRADPGDRQPGIRKTRVICARIAHLVRSGRTEPNAIAAITFTRKAADEMALRLRAMLPAGEAQAGVDLHLSPPLRQPAARARRRHGHRRLPDRRRGRADRRHAPVHVGRRRRHPRPQAAGADPPDERDQEPDARPRQPRQLGRRRARRPQRAAGRRLPDRAGRGRQPRLRRPAARRRAPAPRAPPRAAGRRRALPPHPGGRVPGHEPPAVRPVAPALRRPRRRLRRRRPRPGHLRLARGRAAEHPELPERLPRRPAHRPAAGLPLLRAPASRPPPR